MGDEAWSNIEDAFSISINDVEMLRMMHAWFYITRQNNRYNVGFLLLPFSFYWNLGFNHMLCFMYDRCKKGNAESD